MVLGTVATYYYGGIFCNININSIIFMEQRKEKFREKLLELINSPLTDDELILLVYRESKITIQNKNYRNYAAKFTSIRSI